MTPIERAARELCARNDDGDDSSHPFWTGDVKTVLRAIREPSPAMLDAFVARALQVSIHGQGGWTEYARAQWQTMIDAALREG